MGRNAPSGHPARGLPRSGRQRPDKGHDTQALHRRRGPHNGAGTEVRLRPDALRTGRHRQEPDHTQDGGPVVRRQLLIQRRGRQASHGAGEGPVAHRAGRAQGVQALHGGVLQGLHLQADGRVQAGLRTQGPVLPPPVRILRNDKRAKLPQGRLGKPPFLARAGLRHGAQAGRVRDDRPDRGPGVGGGRDALEGRRGALPQQGAGSRGQKTPGGLQRSGSGREDRPHRVLPADRPADRMVDAHTPAEGRLVQGEQAQGARRRRPAAPVHLRHGGSHRVLPQGPQQVRDARRQPPAQAPSG